MKKFILITISTLFFASFLTAQNNGGGCRKAIVVTPGRYIIDSFVAGTATYSNIFPRPQKAKWYKYTPATDGLMTITSCYGGADSRLFLYTGTCDTLVQSGYNDDFCDVDATSGDTYAASITRPVKANKTYFFEWDTAWDSLSFAFTLSLSPYTPRATQTCETATNLALGVTNVDSLFGFALRGDANRANWYKYTPTKNGRLSISSCGQEGDTRVWMYRGICSNLINVNDSDDDCHGSVDSSAAAITNQIVTAGTTYYFEWDDTWENVPFSFVLTFDALTGVEEERLAQRVVMSPNPASDFVNLDMNFERSTDINIRIFNSIGQAVFSKKRQNILRGVETLDLNTLKSGVYIVEISDGQTRTNKKLVINR
jgi:Secretion system C-terminal sorting domain